jgi:hypothetical protein
MHKIFTIVSLMALVGCAATSAESGSTAGTIELEGRHLTPGVKTDGVTLVSVGCVPASFGPSLARTGGESHARAAAVRSICPNGQAEVRGSQFSDSAVVGDQFCVEVTTPADGITCVESIGTTELAYSSKSYESSPPRMTPNDADLTPAPQTKDKVCARAHRPINGDSLDAVRARAESAFDELEDPNCN